MPKINKTETNFEKYINPYLGSFLNLLHMDKVFVKGEGLWLTDQDGVRYLDAIAAYGAVPFGFNKKEIWDAILQIKTEQAVSFVQPSALKEAGELAEKLIEIAPKGLSYVTFTNSGTESVEAAIKLTRGYTKRQKILSAWNSFHGKTLGSLSATGKESYQKDFFGRVEGFEYVPYGDTEALEEKLKTKEYAAFLVEPIQGEGGIMIPPKGYLKKAQEICRQYGTLLVADEIQTGLGRTGTLFAVEEEGFTPDVMTIAKALGGGIVPIGAMLCKEEYYTEAFGMKHSSTFGGNTLAAKVGLASLHLLTEEQCRWVRETGEYLLSGLKKIQEKYPRVIKEVRGKGLMIGVEFFMKEEDFPNRFLSVMSKQETLTPVITSFLLNREHVRVAPTLNGAAVVRVEPSLIITKEQCDKIIEAFDHVTAILNEGNTAALISHILLGEDSSMPPNVNPLVPEQFRPVPEPKEGDGRFAFLIHPTNLDDFVLFDHSLEAYGEEALQELADQFDDIMEPFVMTSARITSAAGISTYGDFIAIPRTAEELMNKDQKIITAELKQAVKLAKDRGAKIVGLGAYTAPASKAGFTLRNEGIAITTGNSFTVISAINGLKKALEKAHKSLDSATSMVIGAGGSVGRCASILLMEESNHLILLGNPHKPELSMEKLESVVLDMIDYALEEKEKGRLFNQNSLGYTIQEMAEHTGDKEEILKRITKSGEVVLSLDYNDIAKADMIITATNTTEKMIDVDNVKSGAIVCEISRPKNVSEEIKQKRPDVMVIDGGVIALPDRPDLGSDFGIGGQGLVFACMAETILLSLEKHYENTSLGNLKMKDLLYLRELSKKHGVDIAELQSFEKPLKEEDWQKFMDSIQK